MNSERAPLSSFASLTKGLSYQGAYLDQEGPVLIGIGTISERGGFRPEKLRTYSGPHKTQHRIYPGEVYISTTNMAEEMSYKICERCGCPGSANKQGWIMTLCDKCREDLVKG